MSDRSAEGQGGVAPHVQFMPGGVCRQECRRLAPGVSFPPSTEIRSSISTLIFLQSLHVTNSNRELFANNLKNKRGYLNCVGIISRSEINLTKTKLINLPSEFSSFDAIS